MKCQKLKLSKLMKRFDLITEVFENKEISEINLFDLLDNIKIQTNELIINSVSTKTKTKIDGFICAIHINSLVGTVQYGKGKNGHIYERIIHPPPYNQKTRAIDQVSSVYNISYTKEKQRVLVVEPISRSKTLKFLKVNEIWDIMKDYRKLVITDLRNNWFTQRVLIEDPDLVRNIKG